MRHVSVRSDSPALFRRYPALAAALPHVALAERPTPVERLQGLERASGVSPLYVKRDDLSARAYGGNKVRKLEFLLAAARAAGAREVLTFGAAGSNHALATAIHARALGLRSISMLVPQVNARHVRENLLASWEAGAELHHYPDEARLKAGVRYQLLRHESEQGSAPYVITGGGSSPVGTLGFVDAALELKAQVDAGLLAPPAVIYLALGTTGTTAGLRLGLDVAGVRARIVAVRVVHPDIGNPARVGLLYRQTAALLERLDPAFPRVELDPASIEIRHEFFGGRYALYTPAAVAAVARARDTDGLALECTYTGKAFAAFLEDLPRIAGEGPALFWHTYGGRVSRERLDRLDYHALPRALHVYFEEDVQPLDRD
jgi:D-cysteine desulfhydrase